MHPRDSFSDIRKIGVRLGLDGRAIGFQLGGSLKTEPALSALAVGDRQQKYSVPDYSLVQ